MKKNRHIPLTISYEAYRALIRASGKSGYGAEYAARTLIEDWAAGAPTKLSSTPVEIITVRVNQWSIEESLRKRKWQPAYKEACCQFNEQLPRHVNPNRTERTEAQLQLYLGEWHSSYPPKPRLSAHATTRSATEEALRLITSMLPDACLNDATYYTVAEQILTEILKLHGVHKWLQYSLTLPKAEISVVSWESSANQDCLNAFITHARRP